MKLRATDDGHNVYVLYSDLLFNLVILFLVIVLALVLRMHATMQTVAAARTPASETDSKAARDRIAALELTLSRDRAGVEAIRAMVTAAQDRQAAAEAAAQLSAAEVQSLQAAVAQAEATATDARRQAQAQQRSTMAAVAQQLAIAAGANRFTGRSGSTSMSVALDLSGPVPLFVPLSASAFDSAVSTLDAETPDEHKVRAARLLHDAIDGKTRFTAAQLHGLFEALDVVPSDRADPGNREGTLLFTYCGPATLVASGAEGRDGEVNEAAIPAGTLANFADITRQQIDELIGLRDHLRPDRRPVSVPVLHFSAASGGGREVQTGHARFSTPAFRQIVSSFGQGGIVLQYDPAAGEAAPEWVTREVLTPTGYTNAVPDPTELQRLRNTLVGQGR
jgi:hypothetical protein